MCVCVCTPKFSNQKKRESNTMLPDKDDDDEIVLPPEFGREKTQPTIATSAFDGCSSSSEEETTTHLTPMFSFRRVSDSQSDIESNNNKRVRENEENNEEKRMMISNGKEDDNDDETHLVPASKKQRKSAMKNHSSTQNESSKNRMKPSGVVRWSANLISNNRDRSNKNGNRSSHSNNYSDNHSSSDLIVVTSRISNHCNRNPKYCSCCGSRITSKAYSFHCNSAELYDHSQEVSCFANVKVCEQCFKRNGMSCKSDREEEDEEEEEHDDNVVVVVQRERPSPQSLVDIFVDIRLHSDFPSLSSPYSSSIATSNNNSNSNQPTFTSFFSDPYTPNVIRYMVPFKATVSDLKTLIQQRVNKLFKHELYEIKELRRVVKDHTGSELQENLWNENIFRYFPLKTNERLCVYLVPRGEMDTSTVAGASVLNNDIN